jgi:integrase/recombinase XerD
MRLSDAKDLFLAWGTSVRNLSVPTIKGYAGDLQALVGSLGNPSIESITIEEMRRYFGGLSTEGKYAPATIRRRLATVRVFFRFLVEEGALVSSPAIGLRGRFGVARRLPKVMAVREVKALLRCVQKTADPPVGQNVSVGSPNEYRKLRDLSVIELLFSTGMRIGELVALDIGDLNPSSGAVRVMGKGRRERITYVTNREALETIERYIVERKRLALDSPAMFVNSIRHRMTIYSVEFIFRKYAKRARLSRRFTPHCLRHTMATMLLENGADIRVVQEILGHRTITTTQIYTEVAALQKRRALARFGGRNRFHLEAPWRDGTPAVGATAA